MRKVKVHAKIDNTQAKRNSLADHYVKQTALTKPRQYKFLERLKQAII